jgi:hypothetical protein
MAPAKIRDDAGLSALADWRRDGQAADPRQIATAVRYTLQIIAAEHPGATLEVRVPPFGAVQCLEGPKHTRGTPPNVVEMSPEIWLQLAAGDLKWADALREHLVSASGSRASLEGLVPLNPVSRTLTS